METTASIVTAPSRSRTTTRYVGVDLARFLAIVGMMATHLIAINAMVPAASPFEQSAGQIAQTLTSGIAAPLFAVLGGVSAVFATRRLLRAHRVGAAVAAVALRGAILVPIGLLLGMIVSPIVVVLAYYGAAMILVAPLVAAPGWSLAAVALVLSVVGGPLNALVRGALQVVNEGGSVTFELIFADPAQAFRALLLTGEYPAITWSAYLLAGMLIARALVAARERGSLGRTAGILAGAGAAAAAAAQSVSAWVIAHLSDFGVQAPAGLDPDQFREFLTMPSFGAPGGTELWQLLLATPHTGSPIDMLRTAGIACAVIGVLVLLCDGRERPRLGGPLEALRAAGAAPLTIYTVHVIVTGVLFAPLMEDPAAVENGFPWWVAGTGAFALQLAGVLLIGMILARLRRRGPLEALTSGAVRLAVRG